MNIVKAEIENFENIKVILHNAREFMVANGNLVQWDNMEQLEKNVLSDIQK